MANLKKQIALDLSRVPTGQKKEAKDAVGEFLINQVLRDIERGFSPVENEGQFKQLTKEYADREKGGRRTANLQLEGDLKDALRFKRTDEGIEYGNFLKREDDKSDGHNQLSAEAKAWARKIDFPKRRYIPAKNQKFRPGIEREIDKIVRSFEETPIERVTEVTPTAETETGNIVTVEITDVFSDAFIEAEIRRQLGES